MAKRPTHAEKCNHCQGNCACPPSGARRFLDINERVGCIGGTCTCPPTFEPPKVTPIGNMNDLLAQVCTGEHDE